MPEPRCKHCRGLLDRHPWHGFWRHADTKLVNCLGIGKTAWGRLHRAALIDGSTSP